jgi:hypothetical protein
MVGQQVPVGQLCIHETLVALLVTVGQQDGGRLATAA